MAVESTVTLTMLAWIIAAASLWRGLTTAEVDAVAAQVDARITEQALDPLTMTASDALIMLDTAIATVLEQSRR